MSNIFLVSSYILFDFIPHLIIPFLLGLLLLGFMTRFVRNM
jgi:hypothetical protein